MRNIEYKTTPISEHLFIEARLTGPVRNSSWNEFIDEIIEKYDHSKSLYLLIDENNQISEINYYTVQELMNKALEKHFDEVILSFVTSDPIKATLERLFNDMAHIADVPIKVTFHRTIKDAETLIKNFCFKCKSTMFPQSTNVN